VLAAWNPSASMQLQVWDERTGALRFQRLPDTGATVAALAGCAPADCLEQQAHGMRYRLSVHAVDADDARRDLLRRAFAVGLFMLWVATWVVLLVANRISAPLKLLAEQAESLIGNATDQPICVPPTGDEVAALATVLEASRQRLQAQVFRDVLTGLHNRRYLLEQQQLAFERMRSAGQLAALLVMDIDHFKQVNDRHGHDMGDQVLHEVAQRLQACRRESDMLVRHGGEEFVALLPVQAPEEAWTLATRMLHQVAGHPFQLANGTSLPVTISIGIAVGAAPHDGALDAADLFRRLFALADTALYQAKQAGRNRAVQAPQAVPQALAAAPSAPAAVMIA
jgi:diguanylate cyclase (GGDEF)-like protein